MGYFIKFKTVIKIFLYIKIIFNLKYVSAYYKICKTPAEINFSSYEVL